MNFRTRPFFTSVFLALLMLVASGAAALMRPDIDTRTAEVDLEALIPDQVGEWRRVETPFVQVDLSPPRGDDQEATRDSPYDETIMRSYVNPQGERIMLALAYGAHQRQEVKIHRPELCYVAQGFKVKEQGKESVALSSGRTLTTTQLLAQNDRRVEPVTYWIRIGDEITHNAWQSRLSIFRTGLNGRVPDGILVRASQAFPRGQGTVAQSYALQTDFLRALYASLDARTRQLVAGPERVAKAG